MFTFVFLIFLAAIIAYLSYLVKYKKRYNLVVGYSDATKSDQEKSKDDVELLADALFVFAAFLVLFSLVNLFEDWFKILHKDLDGLLIMVSSMIVAICFYIVKKYWK